MNKKALVIFLALIIGCFLLSGCAQKAEVTTDVAQKSSNMKVWLKFASSSKEISISEYSLVSSSVTTFTDLDGNKYITHPANVIIVIKGESK